MNSNTEKLRKKYMDNPPEGMTSEDIRRMSEDDLLDMGTEDNKTTFLTFMTPDEAKAEISRLTDEAVALLLPYENNAVLIDFAAYLATRTV